MVIVLPFTEFAASDPVPGFDDGDLLSTFMDLRQLLDLLLSWDWSTYFHDYGQETSKYLRVSPHRAVIVLDKYGFISISIHLVIQCAQVSTFLNDAPFN